MVSLFLWCRSFIVLFVHSSCPGVLDMGWVLATSGGLGQDPNDKLKKMGIGEYKHPYLVDKSERRQLMVGKERILGVADAVHDSCRARTDGSLAMGWQDISGKRAKAAIAHCE